MQSNSISVKEDVLQDYNNQNIQEETRSNQNINNKVTKEEQSETFFSRLFHFNQSTKLESKVVKTVFSCKRNELTIRGTEYRPEGENLPIAIVCHGFMAFQDTVKQYAQVFASLGYLTYTFDFCGGCVIKGKSDGKTTEMSVLTEVEDLESVIEYARSRKYANPMQLVIMGCSQGGFVSALVAAKEKYPISKLVLFYPAFCIPDDARSGKMMFARFDPTNIPDVFHCGPMKLGKKYAEDVIKMDPFQEIKSYRKDVLIVHGKKDGIVNIRYSEQAYTAYKEIPNRDVQFVIIEKGKHGFSKSADSIAISKLKEFIHL